MKAKPNLENFLAGGAAAAAEKPAAPAPVPLVRPVAAG